MGASSDGIDSQLDFSAESNIRDKIQLLLDAIPDPDTTSTSGSQQGIIGYLDEMGPMAAIGLRVELTALQDDIGGGGDVAFGSHVVTAAEATANLANITTGLANLTLANFAVTIFRAGTNATDRE